MSDGDNYEEFTVIPIGHTSKAGLFRFVDYDSEQIWVPWSVTEDNQEELPPWIEARIYIKEWWAKKKGLL